MGKVLIEFTVEDEGGLVAVYQEVGKSNLYVSKGDVFVPAKFLRIAEKENAKGIPTFEQFIGEEPSPMPAAA